MQRSEVSGAVRPPQGSLGIKGLIAILQLPQDPMLVDVDAPFKAIKFIKFILKFVKYGRLVQNLKGQY